jgi:hypothetical protein
MASNLHRQQDVPQYEAFKVSCVNPLMPFSYRIKGCGFTIYQDLSFVHVNGVKSTLANLSVRPLTVTPHFTKMNTSKLREPTYAPPQSCAATEANSSGQTAVRG